MPITKGPNGKPLLDIRFKTPPVPLSGGAGGVGIGGMPPCQCGRCSAGRMAPVRKYRFLILLSDKTIWFYQIDSA